jgi:nicotinamide mononucleotide transporter
MSGPLSIDTVFFTVLGYPMSYLEFAGTVLYLLSVWLVTRRNILTWPVGIASVLLYLLLFYQIRLYADTLEQVYYLAASVYGWWFWTRARATDRTIDDVSFSARPALLGWLAVTAALSVAAGAALSRFHVWLPGVFSEAASYPYLDALTTVMSLVAMWLMARKHTESWVYWIVVDAIGIWLYFVKDVRFVSLLYVVLLGMAVKGLVEWSRAGRRADAPAAASPALGATEARSAPNDVR